MCRRARFFILIMDTNDTWLEIQMQPMKPLPCYLHVSCLVLVSFVPLENDCFDRKTDHFGHKNNCFSCNRDRINRINRINRMTDLTVAWVASPSHKKKILPPVLSVPLSRVIILLSQVSTVILPIIVEFFMLLRWSSFWMFFSCLACNPCLLNLFGAKYSNTYFRPIHCHESIYISL